MVVEFVHRGAKGMTYTCLYTDRNPGEITIINQNLGPRHGQISDFFFLFDCFGKQAPFLRESAILISGSASTNNGDGTEGRMGIFFDPEIGVRFLHQQFQLGWEQSGLQLGF